MDTVDTHEAFKQIWFSWKIGGIIPFGRKSVHNVYSAFINIVVTIYMPLSLLIDLLLTEDLQLVIANLSMTMTLIVFAMKHFTIIIYRQHLNTIKSILNDLDKRAIHDDEKDSLKSVIRLCHRMFRVYIAIYYPAALFYVIAPLFSHQRLIFPAWFPLDLSVKINYYICYIYQAISIFVIVSQNLTNDIFPPAYICVLTAQIQALILRIQKIGTDVEKSLEENYKELVSCIHDYSKILEFFGEINIIVRQTLFFQFLATATVLCAGAVDILYFSSELFEIFAVAFYLAAIILEVLPVCFCANRLIDFNESLTGAIFSCNWIDQDKKFKKTLIIFMQRTQKPLIMLAGNIVPITLPTFLGIIKFSFSMFTILTQVKK